MAAADPANTKAMAKADRPSLKLNAMLNRMISDNDAVSAMVNGDS
jgi:hypothetical protein